MNSTSSIVTGSATSAAVAIVPLVDWLANTVAHLNMPQTVVMIVSAGLVTGGHLVANRINKQPGGM